MTTSGPGPEEAPQTILLADDDLDILGMMRRHLGGKGYRLLEASDGEEAMALVRKARPDLVILDVMMPGRTGWEICRAIRDDDALVDTGVIMLTGVGERLNEITSPLYGADAYLDKPFKFEDLDRKLAEVLAKRDAEPARERAGESTP